MIKSCSTTNADLLALRTNLFITLDAITLCSESKYAEGSSIKYTLAFLPRAKTSATRCNSPPDNFWTSKSNRL